MNRFAATAAAALVASAAVLPGVASAAITVESDPILFWNRIALANLPGSAPVQTRHYAMVNIAMHDAVKAALGRPDSTYLSGVSAMGGDVRAAASQAAFNVLFTLNTSQAARDNFTQALNASLLLSDPATRMQGVATGAAFGDALIASRMGDGSQISVVYTPGTNPGDWRPTPNANLPGALANWGNVDPFLLASGGQLYPGEPPELGSQAYATAYNEVKRVGAMGSEASGDRTNDQTRSATFWNGANGSQWLQIGTQLAEDEGLSTVNNARLFATLTTALADTQIAGFDAKYLHDRDLWRPVTAIRLGEDDGNGATMGDGSWEPLNMAPAHPSYISTLSALSGAGSTVLTSFLGDDEAFELMIGSNTRPFTGVGQAATDAAESRIYGGIHFRFDSEAGTAMGRQIAGIGLANTAFGAIPEPTTWSMMILGFGFIGWSIRSRRATMRMQPA